MNRKEGVLDSLMFLAIVLFVVALFVLFVVGEGAVVQWAVNRFAVPRYVEAPLTLAEGCLAALFINFVTGCFRARKTVVTPAKD